MRLQASRTLAAAPQDVWSLLAEPLHLADWWPGYIAIRPDRRGFAPGARWQVVRSDRPGFLRRPGGTGLIVLEQIEPGRSFTWRDLAQGFAAEIELSPGEAARTTTARLTIDTAWWRVPVEGLRHAPQQALARLHALCQTAASL